MYIVYDDEPQVKNGRSFDFSSADATKFYLQHYSNRLYLQFIANNGLATFQEKHQARRELEICDRRLEYWKRHANFNRQAVNQGLLNFKRNGIIPESVYQRFTILKRE